MNKYEIMFIVKPDVEEEARNTLIENFKSILTANGGTIDNVNEWGLRDLAYEIKDFKSGFYYVINFDTDSISAVSEFDRQAKNTSDIVRHLITKIED